MDFFAQLMRDKTVVNNPSCPFDFEYTITEEQRDEFAKLGLPFPVMEGRDPDRPTTLDGDDLTLHYISHSTDGLAMEVHAGYYPDYLKECGISNKSAQASIMAIKGYGYGTPGEREREARHALALDPNCCEAYSLLGFSKTSLEEALPCFLKAVEVAPRLTPRFNNYLKDGMWSSVPFRPYIRALLHTANTYRKLKRYREALDYYLKIVSIDNEWCTSSSYFNFRYHIPEMFLRLKDYEGCRKFIFTTCKKVLSECLTYHSVSIPWLFSIALLDFATGKTVEMPSYFSNGVVLMAKHGSAVMGAVEIHHNVVQYLIGEKAIPRIRVPVSYGPMHKPLQAVLYSAGAYDLWHSVPGAVEWLRKCHDTFWALGGLNGISVENPCPGYTTLPFFKKMMKRGIYDKCPVSAPGTFFIHELIMSKGSTYEHLKAYLDQGYTVKTTYHLTPLNMACYYDIDPRCIAALMDAGDEIYSTRVSYSQSPLGMAANQGNWRAMKLFLEERKELVDTPQKKKRILKLLAEGICTSSVPYCLKGMERCTRCVQSDRPHPSTTNFEKCADILIQHGLGEDFAPSSPRHPISIYIRDTLERNKKNKRQQQQQQQQPSSSAPKAQKVKEPAPVVSEIQQAQEQQKMKREKKCSACGNMGTDLLVCSICKNARYCNRECQKADWRNHKPLCKKTE